jgi:hypothetical protein
LPKGGEHQPRFIRAAASAMQSGGGGVISGGIIKGRFKRGQPAQLFRRV